MAEMIVQDNRIRTIRENPTHHADRVKNSQEAFVKDMNAIMEPLVSGIDEEAERLHRSIAGIAVSLKEKLSAYAGTFEAIRPKICSTFDPDSQIPDTDDQDLHNIVSKPILMTTMIGVRFIDPLLGSRVCVRAKIKTWYHIETSNPAGMTASGSKSTVPRKRPHHPDLA